MTDNSLVDRLVAGVRHAPKPPPPRGRGRTPMYIPLIEAVRNAAPQVAIFGPFEGNHARRDAERVRSGVYSYANEHPELLPPNQHIRISIRPDEKNPEALRLYAWLARDEAS